MKQKRQKTEHKKVISALKEGTPLDTVLLDNGILVTTIKEWRKDVKDFDKEYLEAIGLTAKQEQFIEQFGKKMLNVAAACAAVGIHRSTYYIWLDTSDTFKEHLNMHVEKLKDDAESILYQKLFVEKDLGAFDRFAKSKMRDRGYAEQVTNTNINVSTDMYSGKSLKEIDEEIEELQKQLGTK